MELSDVFESVCMNIRGGHATANYYPYTELKHTWRQRSHHVVFKVSDYLKGAPDDVLESLAWYLVSRAFGRKCPSEKAEQYLSYARSTELWQRAKHTYLIRSKNLSLESKGSHRDLRIAFDYVNSTYFRSKIHNPILAWVTESPSRRLGFYFEPLNLLAVNRVFDSEKVPRHALEFVVYHELLHHMDADNGNPRRRIHHTKSFKAQERLFFSFGEAQDWLRRLASANRRKKR